MFNFGKAKYRVVSPVGGKLIPIKSVNDQVFSSKSMGDGFAVIPRENVICSPVNGIIETVFPTKHALGIKCENELEVILHIGIDTVNLQGKGFTVHVKKGQKVKQGQRLVTLADELMNDAEIDLTTIVVFPSGLDSTIDIESKDVTVKECIVK